MLDHTAAAVFADAHTVPDSISLAVISRDRRAEYIFRARR
jgi:hypothetical protein